MTTKEKREYVESILEEPHSLDPRTVEVLEEYLTRQWVSVKERLPEPMTWVLCLGVDGNMRVLRHDNIMDDWDFAVFDGHCYAYNVGSVTHWMPLPDEPKEDA